MKTRAHRALPLAIAGFALLLVLPGAAAAATAGQAVFPWEGLTKAACHGNVSCQPYYPSCAGWSGYSSCGTPFCGFFRGCGDCEEFPCPGPAWKEYLERFRVCFDAQGHSCTEWQTYLSISCGC